MHRYCATWCNNDIKSNYQRRQNLHSSRHSPTCECVSSWWYWTSDWWWVNYSGYRITYAWDTGLHTFSATNKHNLIGIHSHSSGKTSKGKSDFMGRKQFGTSSTAIVPTNCSNTILISWKLMFFDIVTHIY